MTLPSSAARRPPALQTLLDASSLLLRSAGESDMLTRLLDLSRNALGAHAYAVWREFDEGTSWRAIHQHGLSDAYRSETRATGIVPSSIWSIPDALADDRLASDRDAYLAEGIRGMLVVPWKLGHAINGTIVFYWQEVRAFSQTDLDYASALVNLSASALNRIELNAQNHREKQRLSFLAEASAVLASSLDYEATLERVAWLAVPHMADWCTVHILEDGIPNRLVVAHADPEMQEIARSYSEHYPEEIRDDRGLGKVLLTGEPEVYHFIPDELVVQAARDEEHLSFLRKLGLSASILVPLKARGEVLGAIRFLGAGHGRRYTQDDVRLAQDLALRAATAIENAKLHGAVLDQQNELRLSHAAARMGSWSWDQVHQKLFWSPEFKVLHGLAADAVPSFEGGLSVVHPEDRDRVMQELAACLESSAESINQENRSITPDGRVLWLQSRGRIERDASGKAVRISGITIDVTDSRLAEQALRRTEKLAAAARLAATVAHEINNPLEALVNLIYLAQRAEGLPEDAKAHLKIADSELARMTHIVRSTLGFYRESVVPQRVNLKPLVAEVLDLYRSRAMTRGVTLNPAACDQDDVAAVVKGGEIKQVIANLLSNALDATPAGGAVSTSLRRVGNMVEVAVRDTGPGISEANRKHLFEPFFTTKSDVGTGLGLWISKGIVEKHSGTLTVDDLSSAGTTMRILLPGL